MCKVWYVFEGMADQRGKEELIFLSFFYFPRTSLCDQAFYLRKKQSVFWGYAQNLKIQGFAQVGFALFL